MIQDSDHDDYILIVNRDIEAEINDDPPPGIIPLDQVGPEITETETEMLDKQLQSMRLSPNAEWFGSILVVSKLEST